RFQWRRTSEGASRRAAVPNLTPKTGSRAVAAHDLACSFRTSSDSVWRRRRSQKGSPRCASVLASGSGYGNVAAAVRMIASASPAQLRFDCVLNVAGGSGTDATHAKVELGCRAAVHVGYRNVHRL